MLDSYNVIQTYTILQYDMTEQGFVDYCSTVLHKLPASFNYWIGPFFALPQVNHSDTIMPLLSGNGNHVLTTLAFITSYKHQLHLG